MLQLDILHGQKVPAPFCLRHQDGLGMLRQKNRGGCLFFTRLNHPERSILIPLLITDHVCGSAHALLTPYYTSKRRAISNQTPAQPSNLELHAKQVSKRGGDLRVIWDEDKEIVKIAGEVVQTSSGSWVYKSVDKHYPDTYVHEQGWKTSYTW